MGYAVKEAEKCIRILLRLLIHLYLPNVSGLQPPEPKAYGGWEGRFVVLCLGQTSAIDYTQWQDYLTEDFV